MGYLRNMAQIFAGVVAADPCLYHLGRINFCLGYQLRAYSRADVLPTRVRPIPTVLLHK